MKQTMYGVRGVPRKTRFISRRLKAGLLSGLAGNAANMILLESASRVGITTAHGGLLRLLEILLERMTRFISSSSAALHLPLLPIAAPWFQTVFHIATGLVMAELYAVFLEVRLPGGPWRHAAIYGAAVWLVNSLIVLPVIGEGVFGIHHLHFPSIFSFAIAHMSFFVILCVAFQVFMPADSRNC